MYLCAKFNRGRYDTHAGAGRDKNMKAKTRNIILIVALSLFAIIFSGLAMVLHRNTLIEWWKPVIACLIPAIIAGVFSIKKMNALTRLDIRPVNFAAGTILYFALFIGAFYTLNYYNSEKSTHHECEARIENKFTEEHYHVKRLSRNRSVRGEKYLVYYITLQLPGGKIKKIEVGAGKYGKLHPGQKLRLEIENGLFGVPVIKNLNFPVRKYNKRYS